MEVLFSRDDSRDRYAFQDGLRCLIGHTAWTGGTWRFAEDDLRPWNAIQNVNREILQLADFLIRIVRRGGQSVNPRG